MQVFAAEARPEFKMDIMLALLSYENNATTDSD
jgi:hypothetical protein